MLGPSEVSMGAENAAAGLVVGCGCIAAAAARTGAVSAGAALASAAGWEVSIAADIDQSWAGGACYCCCCCAHDGAQFSSLALFFSWIAQLGVPIP